MNLKFVVCGKDSIPLALIYIILTEGPSVVRGKNLIFLAYKTPRPPTIVHKKFQPNRFSRLAGYMQHIYECVVLLYRYR